MSTNCTIRGRLTKDPDLKRTREGNAVCTFSIASNASKFLKTEEAMFISCDTWGALGETLSRYVKKGSDLLLTGELYQKTYQGKTFLNLRVYSAEFIGGVSSQANETQANNAIAHSTEKAFSWGDYVDDGNNNNTDHSNTKGIAISDDELPF